MNQYDEQLTRELQARAGDLPAHPMTLGDVKRRATRIRWQRRALAGTAAAVVLAIAIPVGLSVTGGVDRTSPDLAPQPTPAPLPTEPTHVVLTTDVAEGSGVPTVPYLYDGAIHLPDGSEVDVAGAYDSVAAFGDGWVLTGQDESANRFVLFVDAEGDEVATYPSTGSVALSPDGTLLSYFDTSDDTLRVVGSSGLPGAALPTNGEKELYPAAVFGSGTCEGGSDCTVWFNDQMTGTSGVSSSDGSVDGSGFQDTADITAAADVVGQVSFTDEGSCSERHTPNGDALWQTCDYTLGDFSPDDRLVLGHPAYLDGVGDGLVAILDAASGDMLAEFKNDAQSQAFINKVVWETETSLLATVYQGGAWSLMRMTVDGELTKVMDLDGGEDFSPPLFLPVLP